jgi:hypothetical protein
MEHEAFYAAAAEGIPVLLVVLAVFGAPGGEGDST